MCESYADQSDAESTRVEDMEEDMDSLSNDTSSEPHKPDEEPSILEPVPEEPPIVAEPVTFTLVENGTSRGKTSLVDSLGSPTTSTPSVPTQPTGSVRCAQREIRARLQ